MTEVKPNFYFLSAQKFAETTELSYAETLKLCKEGKLDAYQTDGGQWRIKVQRNEAVSRIEFDKVVNENARLWATIESVKKIIDV